MQKFIYLFAAVLLFSVIMVGGCNYQQKETVPPEEKVEEPASPEEPPAPENEENDRAWKEANQLEPKKMSTLLIEGMKEEIELHLHVSSLYPYAIYLDEERYTLEEREGKDYITPKTEVEPEVYMAIWHLRDVEISELVLEIEEELQEKYAEVMVQGEVDNPLPAEKIYAENGNDRGDSVERYYLVEDFEDGVYVIKQKLFLEAVEGHGARFDGILKEFFAWNPQKGEFVQP